MSSAHTPAPAVSVILCTHNPRADYLSATLESLQLQSLVRASWELLVIDNASESWLAPRLDLGWHPQARVIREETIGLVHARRRGITESRGHLLVFVDDDNVLAPRYLQSAIALSQMHPEIGAFGGQIVPRFEATPPAWTEKYWPMLAIRSFESDRWSNVHDDFAALPCGAGHVCPPGSRPALGGDPQVRPCACRARPQRTGAALRRRQRSRLDRLRHGPGRRRVHRAADDAPDPGARG